MTLESRKTDEHPAMMSKLTARPLRDLKLASRIHHVIVHLVRRMLRLFVRIIVLLHVSDKRLAVMLDVAVFPWRVNNFQFRSHCRNCKQCQHNRSNDSFHDCSFERGGRCLGGEANLALFLVWYSL